MELLLMRLPTAVGLGSGCAHCKGWQYEFGGQNPHSVAEIASGRKWLLIKGPPLAPPAGPKLHGVMPITVSLESDTSGTPRHFWRLQFPTRPGYPYALKVSWPCGGSK